MDQELKTYLDGIANRLDSMDGRLDLMDGRLGRMAGRLGRMDGRLDGMDGRLDGMDGRLGGLKTQIGKTQEQNRHTHILLEALQTQGQVLAEGHAAQDEKIDRQFTRAEDARRDDRRRVEGMMGGLFVSLSRRDDPIENRSGAKGRA